MKPGHHRNSQLRFNKTEVMLCSLFCSSRRYRHQPPSTPPLGGRFLGWRLGFLKGGGGGEAILQRRMALVGRSKIYRITRCTVRSDTQVSMITINPTYIERHRTYTLCAYRHFARSMSLTKRLQNTAFVPAKGYLNGWAQIPPKCHVRAARKILIAGLLNIGDLLERDRSVCIAHLARWMPL